MRLVKNEEITFRLILLYGTIPFLRSFKFNLKMEVPTMSASMTKQGNNYQGNKFLLPDA